MDKPIDIEALAVIARAVSNDPWDWIHHTTNDRERAFAEAFNPATALASALNEPSIWNKAHPAPPIPTPATPAVPVKHLLDWNDKTHGFDCSECKRPAGECAILSPVAIELAPPAMQGEPPPMTDPLTVNDAIDLLKLSMPVADQLKVIAAEFVTARQQLEAALARLTQERDTYAQAAADRGEERDRAIAQRDRAENDPIHRRAGECISALAKAGMGMPGKSNALVNMVEEIIAKARGLELELAAERERGKTLAGLLEEALPAIDTWREGYRVGLRDRIAAALANHPAPANGKEE